MAKDLKYVHNCGQEIPKGFSWCIKCKQEIKDLSELIITNEGTHNRN